MPRMLGAAWRPFAGVMLALASLSPAVRAEEPDTVSMAHDPNRYGIVVSATKTRHDLLDLPNGATVVSGKDLRRSGARTLADALIDVAGVEAGGGSDNGSRLTNIGMWGLKEFDALLVTLDGVPVGGPFNPSLAQIAVEDVERVEIVKGPQGTMHGISAFAGILNVVTAHEAAGRGEVTLGGGDFTNFHGTVRGRRERNGWTMDGSLSGLRDKGWQERTEHEDFRARLSLSHALWGGTMGVDLVGLHDRGDFGSPLPVDAGLVVPGFDRDRNYSIKDSEVKHDVIGLATRGSWPLDEKGRLENSLSFTRDAQRAIRSFFLDPGALSGNTVNGEGAAIEPDEMSVFEDLHGVRHFDAGGKHEMVTGASLTWGTTKGDGHGFDFDQNLDDPASVPSYSSVPHGDNRSFDDKRTYFGFYAHDEWTPVDFFTLSGGGRFDQANEKLTTTFQELSVPSGILETHDSQNINDWSGDIAALVRMLPKGPRGQLDAVNVYGSWKSSFKPAAPNLSEGEAANILDPEHTHSIEGGFKARAFDGQLALDVSGFDMNFTNMVVTILDASSNPVLVNAGGQRFKGWEVQFTTRPKQLDGFALSAGYATHDPRFTQFTFVTPGGTLRDVSGNVLELAPRMLWNMRASFARETGPGAWVAFRHQGERFLNRRNTFTTAPFDEWDAGVNYDMPRFRVAVIGRNLGDSRHYVGESEIGDSQFYVAPPRRITAEVTLPF